MTDPSWYAVHTIARGEYMAHRSLRAAGFDTLYLHYQGTAKHARRVIGVLKPLFPRYLFVGVRPGQSFYTINNTPGVASVVHGNGGPLSISAQVIQDLAARADSDGRVGAPEKAKRRLYKPGERVRVTEGPLAGYDATVCVDDAERITILIDMFRRQGEVQMDPSAVKLASPGLQRLQKT